MTKQPTHKISITHDDESELTITARSSGPQWFKVFAELVTAGHMAGMTNAELRVFVALCHYGNNEQRHAWPGRTLLATATGIDRRTVGRALNGNPARKTPGLIGRGMVRQRAGGGGTDSVLYELIAPPWPVALVPPVAVVPPVNQPAAKVPPVAVVPPDRRHRDHPTGGPGAAQSRERIREINYKPENGPVVEELLRVGVSNPTVIEELARMKLVPAEIRRVAGDVAAGGGKTGALVNALRAAGAQMATRAYKASEQAERAGRRWEAMAEAATPLVNALPCDELERITKHWHRANPREDRPPTKLELAQLAAISLKCVVDDELNAARLAFSEAKAVN